MDKLFDIFDKLFDIFGKLFIVFDKLFDNFGKLLTVFGKLTIIFGKLIPLRVYIRPAASGVAAEATHWGRKDGCVYRVWPRKPCSRGVPCVRCV